VIDQELDRGQMARMGSEHQARLPVPISRIWIDAAREQISHDVGITPPNGIFPTDIHSIDSPGANIFEVQCRLEWRNERA